jgi:long-subunit fatty acid transport protein
MNEKSKNEGEKIMKKTVLVVTVILTLALTTQLIAQYECEFDPQVITARGKAMGNTEVLATGGDALFSNPANIALVKTKEINGGMRMFMGTETVDVGSESYDFSYPFHMKIDHLSFVMPYQIPDATFKTAFGVGYRTYYDYGYNYEFNFEIDEEEYKYEEHGHGGFNTLTFGGALNFNDKFYVGAAFNLGIMGRCKYEYKAGDGPEQKDKMDVSGSFLQLGGTFIPNPKAKIGLMYRPGFKYTKDFKDEGKRKIDIPGIIGLSGQYLITDNLLLVAEYQNRAYEDFEESNYPIFYDIDNGSALRFGGEYLGTIPVRFGMFMESQPVTDEDDTTPKSMLGFTGGVGFPIGNAMTIDVYGQYGMLKQEGTDWENSFHSIKFGAAVKYEL